MLVNGDKLKVTKRVAKFLDEGDIVKVVDVDEDNEIISFAFGENFEHKGMMNFTEYERCFEKVETKTPVVSWEDIDEIINKSDIKFEVIFDKCIVGKCKLPNGFEIIESHICANEEDFNEDIGIEICLDKFEDKIKELETYRLQEETYRMTNPECTGCCECCEDYECIAEEIAVRDELEDMDCENCEDYDCEFNPNCKIQF